MGGDDARRPRGAGPSGPRPVRRICPRQGVTTPGRAGLRAAAGRCLSRTHLEGLNLLLKVERHRAASNSGVCSHERRARPTTRSGERCLSPSALGAVRVVWSLCDPPPADRVDARAGCDKTCARGGGGGVRAKGARERASEASRSGLVPGNERIEGKARGSARGEAQQRAQRLAASSMLPYRAPGARRPIARRGAARRGRGGAGSGTAHQRH